MPALDVYRRNDYSQNGEDGVINEVLRRLDIGRGWFCEFGAWDGRYGSNCFRLLKDGWSGVMLEGEPGRFRRLQTLAAKYPDTLTALPDFVEPGAGSKGLDGILASTPIPSEFEVLSIDIDGLDFQVWEGLQKFRPSVVIIEINSGAAPGTYFTHGESHHGSSFSAMLELGHQKGYTLVCHTGNMIFICDDVVARLALPAADLNDPDALFDRYWLQAGRAAMLRHRLRNMTWHRLICKLENTFREGLPH